jgi:hypothetical protein
VLTKPLPRIVCDIFYTLHCPLLKAVYPKWPTGVRPFFSPRAVLGFTFLPVARFSRWLHSNRSRCSLLKVARPERFPVRVLVGPGLYTLLSPVGWGQKFREWSLLLLRVRFLFPFRRLPAPPQFFDTRFLSPDIRLRLYASRPPAHSFVRGPHTMSPCYPDLIARLGIGSLCRYCISVAPNFSSWTSVLSRFVLQHCLCLVPDGRVPWAWVSTLCLNWIWMVDTGCCQRDSDPDCCKRCSETRRFNAAISEIRSVAPYGCNLCELGNINRSVLMNIHCSVRSWCRQITCTNLGLSKQGRGKLLITRDELLIF